MEKQTLIIRADADKQMGTGHIMRCISLAQEWEKQNGKVTFVSSLPNDALIERLKALNFNICLIDKPYPDPMDIETNVSITKKKAATALVVDGYHFLPDYHEKIKAAGIKLLIIDDYNHLPFYHADIILNQNLGAHKFVYKTLPDTITLSGPDFIMLRDEFLTANRQKRQRIGSPANVLVTMGGTDPDNVTLKVLTALDHLQKQTLNIKIVLGPGNQNGHLIHREATKSAHTCQIITNATDMPGLMLWADIAVSAGGSTAWELLYMQIPSLFIVTADNQALSMAQIAQSGAGINAGRHTDLSAGDISKKASALLQDTSLKDQITQNCARLIDGRGRKRVVSHLRGAGPT